MKQITAIFGGTLERERERVKPMSKIMSISLALFFAVSVTPAVAGDDNDCVSIPNDAGYPYAGQTHCCNRFESSLPAGAHNAKYGDVIPWNQYEGTVLKCIGGTLHDDKWSDPFVSVDVKTRIKDLASEKQVAWYQHFSKDKWRNPICMNGNGITEDGGCLFSNIWVNNGKIYLCFHENRPQDYIDKEVEYLKAVYKNDTIDIYKDADTRLHDTEISYGDLTLRTFKTCAPYGLWESTSVCTYEKEDWKADRNFSTLNMEEWGYELTTIDYNGSDYVCFIHKNYKDIFSKKQNNTDTSSSKEEPVGESEESSSETGIQYNYQQCESDSDCTREKLSDYLSGNPYLHSTEWYCIEQSAGNKVCASKACENDYHIAKYANGNSKGFCEKDAPVQPNANVGQSGQSGANGSVDSANANSSSNKIVVTELHDTDKKSEEIKKLTEKINKTYTELQGLTKNLSAWKNTEGKFNTARLASDSTAAVVLGTVGGVVTAKLVKKSQVKKGFESLQCYIGGQPIAAYGDEVTIGR